LQVFEWIEVPSGMWFEFVWRDLQRLEALCSSGEVNRLIDRLRGERLPAIDLAHGDLAGSEQSPE
jgi:hypothetical protein